MFVRFRATLCVLAVAGLGAAGCSKDPKGYFESGNRYFDEGKYAEAIVEYRNAIQQDPRFGDARYKLAEAYARINDVRNAYREYVRAADLLPANADAQVKAGNFLLLARQFEDARARAEKALAANPKSVDAQVLLANSMAGLRDLDGAVKEMEEAIALDPSKGATFASLGALEMVRGNQQEAEEAFKKAIGLDPKSVLAHLALANFYWSQGRQPEAEAVLQSALALDAKNETANRALAVFYVSSGQPARAEQYLRTLADIAPAAGPRLGLADYYLAMNRSSDALALYEQVARDPKDAAAAARAKVRIAALHFAENRKADGYKTIDDVLAKDPKNAEALVVKARFLSADGKVDDALAAARTAAQANASDANAQYALGVLLAQKTEYDEAAKAFNEVLRLNPRATTAQVQLARLELLRGAPAASVRLSEQALQAEPGNPVVRLVLARGLLGQRELDRAEREVDALVQAYPKLAQAQSLKGLIRLARNDAAGARAAFQTALENDPADLEAFGGMLTIERAEGKRDAARARLEQRLAQDGSNARLLVLAGRFYFVERDWTKAEQSLRKAIELDPSLLEAYGLLGQAFIVQNQLDRAQREFEALVARRPKAVGAHTMIGMLLQAEGKRDEAVKRYEQVLQIDPRAAVAANNLAWLYAEGGGNLDVALQLAQTAKQQLPEQPEVLDTLGYVYLKKDLASLAIPEFQAAAERQPQNPEFRFRLGLAYQRAGNSEQAKRALQEALKLKPDFQGAEEARKVLASLGA